MKRGHLALFGPSGQAGSFLFTITSVRLPSHSIKTPTFMVSSYKVAQAPRSTLGSVSRDTSTMNLGSSATLTNAVSSTLTSPQFGSGIKINLLMILCLVTRRPPGLDRLPGDPPHQRCQGPLGCLERQAHRYTVHVTDGVPGDRLTGLSGCSLLRVAPWSKVFGPHFP